MRGLGVVTGLQMEATCIAEARPDLAVLCGGMGPARAGRAADRLVETGATALASVGFAGGLDPRQPSGTIVIADQVLTATGEVLGCDRDRADAIAERAKAQGLQIVRGHLAGSDDTVASASAKLGLYAATGAVAVDMESHAVARAAVRAGLPFVAVRVVADAATRSLPTAALAGVAPDGSNRVWAVIAALIVRPWQLRSVLALARDSRCALASLAVGAGLLA